VNAKMKWITITIYSTLCLAIGVGSVDIISLDIPESAESGEDIVLDCKYEYRPEEKEQLDIKWYFNNSPTPFYQWLPAMHTGPQIIDPRFSEILDLEYTVNNQKFEKHRALHLVNITRQFTGSYMCKVSSFVDEDFNRKSLQVYVAPSVVKFSHETQEAEDRTQISCSAEGMYPTPAIRVFWKDGLLDHEVDKTVVSEDPDGMFSILLSTNIHKQFIRGGVELGCEISIPGTGYSITEELVISPAIVADPRVSGANTMSSYLPITLLLLVLLNQSAFRILSLSQSEKRQSSMSQSESSSDKINQSETRSDSFSQSETKSIIEMSLDL